MFDIIITTKTTKIIIEWPINLYPFKEVVL